MKNKIINLDSETKSNRIKLRGNNDKRNFEMTENQADLLEQFQSSVYVDTVQ